MPKKTTGIDWTEKTWNPVVGCAKVSEGCDGCYAIEQAERITKMQTALPPPKSGKGKPRMYLPSLTVRTDEGVDWTGEVRVAEHKIKEPLGWREPQLVFVNSMSDLFHKDVPGEALDAVFSTMSLARQHTFQVLTKRSKRMRDWLSPEPYGKPDSNVWLGVSVESAKYRFRIDHLRETPAAVRWLSIEPLVGRVGELDLEGIDWVVVGGESGPNARPMDLEWAREIRDQCVETGVPFFFKQWGRYSLQMHPHQPTVIIDGFHWVDNGERNMKYTGYNVLDGRTWQEYPE